MFNRRFTTLEVNMLIPLDPQAPTDFNFFIGNWNVSHRRLKKRLVGCSDWESFQGICVAQQTLGGFGNIDDNILQIPSGTYRAVTLRSFNPQQGTWSIWWLDGRSPGNLDVPVVGRFANRVGTFLADDTLDGKPIQVKFEWTLPGTDTPRWEQAFSPDAGKTWETNWVMDFTRRECVQAVLA
jgi:hypothetical protein